MRSNIDWTTIPFRILGAGEFEDTTGPSSSTNHTITHNFGTQDYVVVFSKIGVFTTWTKLDITLVSQTANNFTAQLYNDHTLNTITSKWAWVAVATQ